MAEHTVDSPTHPDYHAPMTDQNQQPERTEWHEILGQQLRLLLTPLDLTVETNLNVSSFPPKIDILILRRTIDAAWTASQRACLPDGIRDSAAAHILIEFKFTESLTHHHLKKVQGYEAFYRQARTLQDEPLVQSFILSAKTPQAAFRERYGYVPTAQAGVYRSQNVLLARTRLITLNELADTPYNAYVKCFASQAKERRKAFAHLTRLGIGEVSRSLWFFLLGLRSTMNVAKEADEMRKVTLTAEEVAQLGEELGTEWIDHYFTTEEILSRYKPEEVLSLYKPEEVLSRYKPEEVLSLYKPEEVLSRYKPEEVLSRYKPEEVLSRYKPEEVVSHHKPTAQYMLEREKALRLQGLKRTLQIRLNVSEAQWEQYQQRLQNLDPTTLDKLSETALLVANEADFEQALSEIERSPSS